MAAGSLSLVAPINSARQHPSERIHARTKVTIAFTVKERDQVTVVDLTGRAVQFQARTDLRSTTLAADITGTIITAASGRVDVAIPETAFTEAGVYWADLQILESATPGDPAISVVSYRFAVLPGATI